MSEKVYDVAGMAGVTKSVRVKVRLHRGSVRSFSVVMYRLTDEVRQQSPWTMIFVDDIVIFSEGREETENELERWRYALYKWDENQQEQD